MSAIPHSLTADEKDAAKAGSRRRSMSTYNTLHRMEGQLIPDVSLFGSVVVLSAYCRAASVCATLRAWVAGGRRAQYKQRSPVSQTGDPDDPWLRKQLCLAVDLREPSDVALRLGVERRWSVVNRLSRCLVGVGQP